MFVLDTDVLFLLVISGATDSCCTRGKNFFVIADVLKMLMFTIVL